MYDERHLRRYSIGDTAAEVNEGLIRKGSLSKSTPEARIAHEAIHHFAQPHGSKDVLYSGGGLDPEKLSSGGTFYSPAHISASRDMAVAKKFAGGRNLLHIHVNPETKTVDLGGDRTHHPHEKEVVIPSGSVLKHIKTEVDKDGLRHHHCEIVDQTPKDAKTKITKTDLLLDHNAHATSREHDTQHGGIETLGRKLQAEGKLSVPHHVFMGTPDKPTHDVGQAVTTTSPGRFRHDLGWFGDDKHIIHVEVKPGSNVNYSMAKKHVGIDAGAKMTYEGSSKHDGKHIHHYTLEND